MEAVILAGPSLHQDRAGLTGTPEQEVQARRIAQAGNAMAVRRSGCYWLFGLFGKTGSLNECESSCLHLSQAYRDSACPH